MISPKRLKLTHLSRTIFITARKRSLRRLRFYTCLSFFSRGGLSFSACRDTNPLGADTTWIRPLGSRHPPEADTPQADTHPKQTPPIADTPPPQSSACWEIRAITGRYASYWNAYLFSTKFCTSQKVLTIPYLDRSVYVY